MNTLINKLAGIALVLVSLPTQAVTINLNPVTQTITAGSSFEVTLDISGLITGAAPSLGAFDLDVGFDSGILSFTSVVFGDPLLGDQLDLLGLGSMNWNIAGPGSVNLFELSLDTAADLDALQADSFTLATLTFNAFSTGTSSLGISINSLSDAYGDTVGAAVAGARVSVTGQSVPEPSMWWLLGLGALMMSRFIQQPFRRAGGNACIDPGKAIINVQKA